MIDERGRVKEKYKYILIVLHISKIDFLLVDLDN